MIDIICEDEFFRNNLVNLFEQKKIQLKNMYSNRYFFQLKFYQENNNLCCLIDNGQIKFSLPKNFNEIFEKIFELVSNKSIYVKNFEYYPLKQLIKNNEKTAYLSEIQNKILIYLFLNLDKGIEKIVLIKNIWPKDKEIFLNKLDTHLTNLKNQIFRELGFDLKFSSKSGILKLIIN